MSRSSLSNQRAGPRLMAGAMRVYSRGTVSVEAIEFNMLADERDLDLLRVAARQMIDIAHSESVSAVAVADEISTTDEWLLGAAGDYFHAAGSCRMGAASDPLAVVDHECRVIGYEALVVCDASVMPNLPRANPCLPIVMIAERVSAMIGSA